MKNIFKYLSVAVLLAFAGCELTNLDHLENPNGVSPDNAESRFIFYSVQLGLEDFFNTVQWNSSSPCRMMAMTGGNIYNNAYGAGTYNFAWNVAYSNLFPDMDALITVANTEGSEFPALAGATKIMKAYVMMTLVDLFGNVPYSEAGQGVTNKSPNADDQKAVYDAALALLNDAIKDLGTPGPVIDSGDDLFYGGNTDNWLKLANSLKIKWHVTSRLAGGSGSEVAAAAANAITAGSADFSFPYGSNRVNPDARHPWYANYYEVGGGSYLSNYYMWSLNTEKGFSDPRTRYYFYRQDANPQDADPFTLDCNTVPRPIHYTGAYPFCVDYNGGYWGRDHGNDDGIPPDTDRRTAFGLYPAGGKFDSDEGVSGIAGVNNGGTDGALGAGIAPIMMASFTHFMLAEAALTMSSGGDAKDHLESGIRESMDRVRSFEGRDGGADASFFMTDDDINAYVDFVLGAYDAAGSVDERLNIVIKEYHIAAWGNGIEMYNAYRRTGMPNNMQPALEQNPGDFPRLMFYPADYVNLNANASQRALTEQVFWDTNPGGIYDF